MSRSKCAVCCLLTGPATADELNHYAQEMLSGGTDRDIEQEITNLPEYGQHPSASPAGTGARLPDYYQQQGAIAAKALLFSKLDD